ncbi:MAG: PilN domain-containing protein [Candidatus Marinimicrobia bacterium]|nr:PilN domain-containing protein [Candidatus Neomarinimicrobiota bacterium]
MINAIKINLNHASSKAARVEIRRERLRWTYFGLVLLFLSLNGVWLMYENTQFNNLIEAKKDQMAQIEAQIEELKQEGMDLSRDDIIELSKLERGRKLWSSKLNALGLLIPHDMALTHLDYKSDILIIEGISRIYHDEREFDIIEEFIERLKSSELFSSDFTDIKFSKYSRLTIMAQDVVNFEIKGYLKNDKPKKKKRRASR